MSGGGADELVVAFNNCLEVTNEAVLGGREKAQHDPIWKSVFKRITKYTICSSYCRECDVCFSSFYLSFQSHTIALPIDRRVSDGGGIEDKGILITADVDISVQIGLLGVTAVAAEKVRRSMNMGFLPHT